MNYSLLYNKLILNAKNRKKFINSERHHIIPKFMGGSNKTENMVYLTAKEHFIAHHLLWKIHRTVGMAQALYFMRHASRTDNRKINPTEYEKIKNTINQHLSILGKELYKNKKGIHSLTPAEHSKNSKLSSGGKVTTKLKLGVHSLNKEQLTECSRKAGNIYKLKPKEIIIKGVDKMNATKTPQSRKEDSINANLKLRAITKEKWLQTLVSKNLPLDFTPNKKESIALGLIYYWGKICKMHPEENGKRHLTSNGCCIYHKR